MNQASNFLSRLSDAWLVALLCVLVPGMFSTGFYLGTQQTDRETVHIQQENKALKDSLAILTHPAAFPSSQKINDKK